MSHFTTRIRIKTMWLDSLLLVSSSEVSNRPGRVLVYWHFLMSLIRAYVQWAWATNNDMLWSPHSQHRLLQSPFVSSSKTCLFPCLSNTPPSHTLTTSIFWIWIWFWISNLGGKLLPTLGEHSKINPLSIGSFLSYSKWTKTLTIYLALH